MFSIQELRSMTKKELLHELDIARKALLHVRIGIQTRHQKDTSLKAKNKVTIARILTVLREQEK